MTILVGRQDVPNGGYACGLSLGSTTLREQRRARIRRRRGIRHATSRGEG
jgi:hypothetical protein